MVTSPQTGWRTLSIVGQDKAGIAQEVIETYG